MIIYYLDHPFVISSDLHGTFLNVKYEKMWNRIFIYFSCF